MVNTVRVCVSDPALDQYDLYYTDNTINVTPTRYGLTVLYSKTNVVLLEINWNDVKMRINS